MPSNTAKGWPYPLATEPVAAGASNIQAVADKADVALPFAQWAGLTTVAITSSTVGTILVTFPVGRFTAGAPNGPRVMATVRGTSQWFAYVSTDPVATGVTIGVRKSDTTPISANIPVDIYAVQMLATAGPG